MLKFFIFSISMFAAALCYSQYQFDAESLIDRVKIMSSNEFQGRETGTEGAEKTRTLLLFEFKQAALNPFGKFLTDTFSDAINVVGMVRGTKHPDKYIVISAHYDHLGVHDGEIFNGADDNASGVSALIALAHWFSWHTPEHSIVFAAFDAEENGLVGAKHFVDNLPVKAEQIVLNINMDMISRNEDKEIYICGTRYNKWLRPFLAKVAKDQTITVKYGHDGGFLKFKQNWTKSSDHFPFHKLEIPFVYFGVEDHEDYHKHTDMFESIDPEFYKNVMSYILNVTCTLDQSITY
ncbi:MAG: Zn-dependent M28 family amino/carboxypeptidase [Limisphaerales bacterium]|jgi:Zn-dependent M28 family amino/carboxypeptidase